MLYAVVGALLIGVTLGLLGSGGSILTVPVLVYLLERPEKLAISESLAIVGGIALVGVAQYASKRQTQWRYVALFGVPGMAGAYLGAMTARYVPGALQLAIFAVVMLAAAAAMLRGNGGRRPEPAHEAHALGRRRALEVVLMGTAVGMLTGFVGVGGGFLIVPALVLLAGLPIRGAIGTSLAIIFLNCLVGFIKNDRVLHASGMHADWALIGTFVSIGGVGSIVGSVVSSRVNQRLLRKIFAVFLVLMGLFILARETPRLVPARAGGESGSPA